MCTNNSALKYGTYSRYCDFVESPILPIFFLRLVYVPFKTLCIKSFMTTRFYSTNDNRFPKNIGLNFLLTVLTLLLVLLFTASALLAHITPFVFGPVVRVTGLSHVPVIEFTNLLPNWLEKQIFC